MKYMILLPISYSLTVPKHGSTITRYFCVSIDTHTVSKNKQTLRYNTFIEGLADMLASSRLLYLPIFIPITHSPFSLFFMLTTRLVT